jgi:predicted transcriptional regulator
MQALEKIEAEVRQLTVAEQEALRDWLDHLLEDRLELKEAFKAEIEAGVKDIAEGRYRIHRP